jgi:FtsH-binding integral membrane protein
MILIMWGFMNMLFPIGGGVGHMVFSLLGALLFTGYILYAEMMVYLVSRRG